VVQRILGEFTVISRPEIHPISLRESNAEELSRLVYITHRLALKIVRYRDSVGELKSLEELTKLQDFPADRFNRIKLYLTL
jgi:DNA uptake protein ComE-like DNA-binding protein